MLARPNETTLAVTRLIYAGTLEHHPNLRLVLANGGGNLIFMKGRINLGYTAPKYEYNAACHANISKPPGTYYDQLLFDTAVGSRETLRFLIQIAGVERVVFGSDDPFEIADADGSMALPEVRSMAPADRDRILSGTIARLLEARQD